MSMPGIVEDEADRSIQWASLLKSTRRVAPKMSYKWVLAMTTRYSLTFDKPLHEPEINYRKICHLDG
jgi:hypothetical protein